MLNLRAPLQTRVLRVVNIATFCYFLDHIVKQIWNSSKVSKASLLLTLDHLSQTSGAVVQYKDHICSQVGVVYGQKESLTSERLRSSNQYLPSPGTSGGDSMSHPLNDFGPFLIIFDFVGTELLPITIMGGYSCMSKKYK